MISVPGAATNTIRRVRGATGFLSLRSEPDWRCFLFTCLPRRVVASTPHLNPLLGRGGEAKKFESTHSFGLLLVTGSLACRDVGQSLLAAASGDRRRVTILCWRSRTYQGPPRKFSYRRRSRSSKSYL